MLLAIIIAILITLLATRTSRRPRCPNCGRRMRKNGKYWRKKDERWVQRYYCPNCGKTIVSPRLEQPENPKCRKCGRIMRSHGSYKRKSDEVAVRRYYCPDCRITLQIPARPSKRHKTSRPSPIFIDKILGVLSLIKKCPYCGGKAIRYGRDRLKSGFIVQVYKCKSCNRKFRFTTFIRMMLRRIYPPSPCCHRESVRCGRSKNRQRFKCKECGKTFISKISVRTTRTMLKSSLDQARKYFLPLAGFVLRLFGEVKGVGSRILKAIELGLRWIRLHNSYSSLEATLISSRTFSISLDDVPDDNTIQRWVSRTDISILQELIDFTYSLAKRYVPKLTSRTLDLLVLGIDSTVVTMIAPWYLQNSKTIEFHVGVDLDLQMVYEINFDEPPSSSDMGSQSGIIGLALGDSAYFQKIFTSEHLSRGILPVVRPKNVRYSDPLLRALEWLFDRYLRVIYRIRGLVEAAISRLAPHTNKTRSSSPRGYRVETLLRGLSQNILSLGCVLDRYVREGWGLTIGDVVWLARESSRDEREAFDTSCHMLLFVLGLEKRSINSS